MLTAAQGAHFDLFGFVVLRSLLNAQEVDQLRAEVDGALRDAFAYAYASNTRHEVADDDDVAGERYWTRGSRT